MKKNAFLLLIILAYHLLSFSQEINGENIKVSINDSYAKLSGMYYQLRQKGDLKNAKAVAKIHLQKAKNEQDIEARANAYYELAYTSYKEETLKYADSVILMTKNHVTVSQPALAHIIKVSHYSTSGFYKEAFIELEKAYTAVQLSGNTELLYGIKYMFARLKSEVGDYESSLDWLRSLNLYYSSIPDISEFDTRSYIMSLYACANNFNFLKQPDSAKIFVEKAIPLSLKTPDSLMYHRLLLSSAILNYQKNNYSSSLDSIFKLDVITKHKNLSKTTLVLRHLFQGKNYLKQNKNTLAVNCFKKIDSISITEKYYHPIIRENYQLLINFYKKQKDTKNQLFYIDRLLKADSIIDKDFSYLANKIDEKYTIPNLVLEKENIIKSLKRKNLYKRLVVITLLLFAVVLVTIIYRNNKKRRQYKNRIKELNTNAKVQSSVVNDETTKRILDQLSEFENSELFLDKDFNLSVLAKMLNTNTSYLSKIINEHKQKTFKQYLVGLRIKVLLNSLDENPMMRKHSIEALAESIGYSNASSFTRIFKNYLGASPSSFLKKRYSER